MIEVMVHIKRKRLWLSLHESVKVKTPFIMLHLPYPYPLAEYSRKWSIHPYCMN